MPQESIVADLTPAALRCGTGSCPAVYALSSGRVLIVGTRPEVALAAELQGKIADSEAAVIVDRELLQQLLDGQMAFTRT